MKRSIYNRIVNLDKNRVAVYNTLTGALCVFEQDEYKHYFINDINNLTSNEVEYMKRNTFFVSDDTDELSMVLSKRENQILNPVIPTYRILVTTACNARCSYCFEQGIKFTTMDIYVADALVDFILKESHGCSKIKVQWFGGEPLMNFNIIKYITEKLNDKFDGNIIYSIITNGSLLTKAVAKELVKLGVRKAQITLDGDKTIYEERKNYINKNITFESIISNITSALEEGLAVVVRLNYDKNTIISIKHLVKDLGVRFCHYKNFSCYPYSIYGTYNGASKQRTNRNDLFDLHTQIVNMGIINTDRLFRSALGVKDGPCMAYNRKSFFISPQGKLFKCSIDMKNNVGNVFDGVKHNKYFFEWSSTEISQICLSCDLLPVCQGGCRAGALNKLPITCMRDKDIVDDIIRMMVASSIN